MFKSCPRTPGVIVALQIITQEDHPPLFISQQDVEDFLRDHAAYHAAPESRTEPALKVTLEFREDTATEVVDVTVHDDTRIVALIPYGWFDDNLQLYILLTRQNGIWDIRGIGQGYVGEKNADILSLLSGDPYRYTPPSE